MGVTASVPVFLCPVGTHPRCVHIAFLYKSCAFIIRTYLGYVPTVICHASCMALYF